MNKYGGYAKYKKDAERRLVARRLVVISIILFVLSVMVLCGYLFSLSHLYYWNSDIETFGLMFSIGSHLFRFGQVPFGTTP